MCPILIRFHCVCEHENVILIPLMIASYEYGLLFANVGITHAALMTLK